MYIIYIYMYDYICICYVYLLYSQSWNTLRNPRALLLEAVLYVDAPIPFPHPHELKNLRSTYCAIIQDSGDMSTCCWTQVCLIITINICWYRLIWWILPSKLPKLVHQYVSTVINLLVGNHRESQLMCLVAISTLPSLNPQAARSTSRWPCAKPAASWIWIRRQRTSYTIAMQMCFGSDSPRKSRGFWTVFFIGSENKWFNVQSSPFVNLGNTSWKYWKRFVDILSGVWKLKACQACWLYLDLIEKVRVKIGICWQVGLKKRYLQSYVYMHI